jgi:hypothetical protein
MRIIDESNYYQLSGKDLETMRTLLCGALSALEEKSRTREEQFGDPMGDATFLRLCIEGHRHDDVLALLSLAANVGREDILSPAALQLVQGHNLRGKLTGVCGWVSLLDVSHPIRQQIISLVNRAALLSFSEEEKADLGDAFAHLRQSPASAARAE